MKLINQNKILTSIVGSYPKPTYLFLKSGRELIDSAGVLFETRQKELGKQKFKQLLDKAALQAIEDQNKSGIDIVTDGEERRSQYVMHIAKGLKGISFKKRKRVAYRGGVYERDIPIIVGPIRYKGPIVLKDFLFTKKHAKAIAKICLPGPSTLVDSLFDKYYQGNLEKIAFDYAKAIREEVKNLIQAGCKIIQFDDPVLLRFPDRAKNWGIKSLEACFAGLEKEATYFVHICRGYPNKPLERKGIQYKANKNYYQEVLSLLSKSQLDGVSIEGEQSKLDLSVIPAIGEKTLILGILDVGVNTVESVASLVKRGKEALKYLPKNQLILAPDCGLVTIKQSAAFKKLRNLALAAKKLNQETHI